MATGNSGGMSPEMMQQLMAQQQAGSPRGASKNETGITESAGLNGEYPSTYVDIRKTDRFKPPSDRVIGRNSRGTPVSQANKVVGIDPFQKFIKGSQKKVESNVNLHLAQEALFKLPLYTPNFTPLHDIMAQPHWSKESKNNVLSLALEYGADPDLTTGYPPETPLARAFATRNVGGVSTLVNAGADLNKTNIEGERSLNLALRAGMPELLPMLVTYGAQASPNAKGETLTDISIQRFMESTSNSLATDVDYQNAFDTMYKSMAYIKKYKLHMGNEFDFEPYKEKLLKITKNKPAYAASINDMSDALKQVTVTPVEPKKILDAPRLYTNVGNGLNDPVNNRFNHPWLGFLSFIDDKLENLEREKILENSQERVQALFENMEYLKNPDFLKGQMLKRKEISLDIRPAEHNSLGDTLLTKAIRDGNYEAVQGLAFLNVNLHSTDHAGNTGMHILARNCKDQADFMNVLTKMVGTLNPDGSRSSLFEHGNHADWHIKNAEGKTFMDVLQEAHPEWIQDAAGQWPKDCWYPNIQEQLGIPAPASKIPEWNLKQGLLLGLDAPKLMLAPRSATETPSEKGAWINQAITVLSNTKQMEMTGRTTSLQMQGKEAFNNALTNLGCTPETKLGILTGLISSTHIDPHVKEKIILQVAASFSNDLRNAKKNNDNALLEEIVELTTKNAQDSDSDLVFQLVTQQGVLTGNKDIEQMGIDMQNILEPVMAKKYQFAASNDNLSTMDPNSSNEKR